MNIIFLAFLLILRLKCNYVSSLDEYGFCDLNDYDIANWDSNSTFYLMPGRIPDNDHEIMNNKFFTYASFLGYQVERIEMYNTATSCKQKNLYTDLEITEQLSQNHNIINLKVHIPFNYIQQHGSPLISVGIDGRENIAAKVNRLYIENNTDSYHTEDFTDTKIEIGVLYTKLISGIKEDTLLYKLAEQIDAHNEIDPKMIIPNNIIVICVPNYKILKELNKNRKEWNWYEYYVLSNCDHLNEFAEYNVLAIIAPEPFKNEEMASLPVLFYDKSFLSHKDKVVYPNSTTVFADNYIEEMAKVFLKLFQDYNWKRVAIVSDNSFFSESFEAKMVELFKEKQIVYEVQQCEGVSCDFSECLKRLKDVEAKVIIANVDENNAKRLVEQAHQMELTAHHNRVMWIFRDWPKEKQSICDAAQLLGDLSMIGNNNERKHYYKVLTAMNLIKQAIFNDAETLKMLRQKTLKERSELVIKLIEQQSREKFNIIESKPLSMLNKHKCIFEAAQGPYIDVQEECKLRSNKFKSPCEEMYPVYIILAILSVLLTVLIIVLFLFKCAPRFRNYRKFF